MVATYLEFNILQVSLTTNVVGSDGCHLRLVEMRASSLKYSANIYVRNKYYDQYIVCNLLESIYKQTVK